MEREHCTVWVSLHNSVELSQKRSEEATVATLKTQFLKIDSFSKKMESKVWAYIIQINELTYAFNQLRQRFEHVENLDDKSSGR